MCAGTRAEVCNLPEIVNRQNARKNRNVDACAADALNKTLIEIIVEEELSDRPVCASIYLPLEEFDISRKIPALRMLFWISGHRDIKIADCLETCDQIR